MSVTTAPVTAPAASGPRNRRLAIISHIAAGLGALLVLFIAYNYLFAPESAAPQFGLAAWPSGDGEGFLNLKGVRDAGFGLIILILLATRQTRALGWVLIGTSWVPFGDAFTVLSHGGSVPAALFIHTLTALYILATGIVIAVNEAPRRAAAGAKMAAAADV